VQIAALMRRFAGALLLTWTERNWPDVQEAVIGVTFVLGATGSVLLLASNAARKASSFCAPYSSG
jgi:zinc/manganese transport system permease protein